LKNTIFRKRIVPLEKMVNQWYTKYIRRPTLAFFRMPGSRGFGILLLIFILIVFIAVVDLRLNYVNPDTGRHLDIFAAFYAVFALLVFETPLPLPDSWITRLAFLAVPISGILVFGQGLVRVGSSLLNINLWNRAMASTYRDHIIVCGLGKVSLRVVRWILDLGETVVVVDIRPDNPFIDEVRSWDVPVFIADARRPEVLRDAGIMSAVSIVPCTNDDLTNLSIALEARQLKPGMKVVLRMFDQRMAGNLETGFDIHTAFSIPDLSVPAFAAAATKAPLDYAFAYGDGPERGLLTITEFTLVSQSILTGYTVGQLEQEFKVAVIAHRQDGRFKLHPTDETVLSSGDHFVLSASIDTLHQIAALTPPTREMDLYEQKRWPIKTK
jgi:Trk K+ transport system NAD-binding subunit